jgi:hypothetical protein
MSRKAKRLTVAVSVIVLAFVLAIAAWAAIQVRADIDVVDATSGTATLDFTVSSSLPLEDGPVNAIYLEWDAVAVDWLLNPAYPANTFPAGVTASGTVTNGKLSISTTGLLIGEAVRFTNLYIVNGSSVTVDGVAFDYGAGVFGPEGSGTPFELQETTSLAGKTMAAGALEAAQFQLIPTVNDGVTYSDNTLGITATGSR